MSYVIYETKSTKLLTSKRYMTKAAAKAGLTRILNKEYKKTGSPYPLRTEYSIAETDIFFASIEKRVPRENMMSGKIYYEGVNTPSYCSPASEAYWSM